MLLPDGGLGVGGCVPYNHRALVVAAGQRGLVETRPGDARDLAAAHLNKYFLLAFKYFPRC